MAATVLKFESKPEPHMSGEVECPCGHTWAAVMPIGTTFLECPECHGHFGRLKYEIERDGLHWVCNCGNRLFRMTPEGIYCPFCGEWQEGF